MATIADLNTLARRLVDADTTSYTAANLLIDINNAYEEVAALILGADGRWQWDDTNRTTFPEGTTTLVNSQADYTLDTTYIKVLGVSVMDVNGNYYKLRPFDPEDLETTFGEEKDRTEFFETDGKPFYYDIQGNSVVLYPAPDNGVSVTLAAGLKVYAQRTSDNYTAAQVTTGTKVPGFASPFHHLLSYKAALVQANLYKPQRVPYIASEVARLEKGLTAFYGRRNRDERQVMTAEPVYNPY